MAAAGEAWTEAGLDLTDQERERAGVLVGTGMGGITRQDDAYRDLYERKVQRSQPVHDPPDHVQLGRVATSR